MGNNEKIGVIDGIDRDILRGLYISGSLTGNEISLHIGVSPPAAMLRLKTLEKKGIVKKERILATRVFKRKISGKLKTIKSSRGIYWAIDIKK
jgi:DNA-binding Lrp family transcriptional regulator